MSGRFASILAVTILLSFTLVAQTQNPSVFNPGPNTGPLSFPQDFLSADLNSDGRADAVAVQSAGNNSNVAVFINNGNGTYTGPRIVDAAGTNAHKVAVRDFNQDGNLDLAVISGTPGSVNGSVTILLGDGQGNFGSPMTYGVTGYPTGITTGDFNNDGLADIAISAGLTKKITILTNTGNGFNVSNFDVPTYYDSHNPGYQPDYIFTIVAGDFNADGKMDLIYGDQCGDGGCVVSQESYYLLTNTGNGFTPTLINQNSTGAGSLQSSDLDGDGRADIYFAYHGCYHTPCIGITALYSNGDGTFDAVQVMNGDASANVGEPSDPVAGDFNNDGITDIAVAAGSRNNVSPGLEIYRGKGGRSGFSAPDHFDSPNGTAAIPMRIAAGFVDGDGSEDVLVGESGNIVPYYNKTSQTNSPCIFPSSPGLNLCQPTTTSTSQVHFVGSYHAVASPANRIELWLDSRKMFQVFSNRLDTNLTLPEGTHQVTLVGVDAAGKLIKSVQDFTVGPAGSPCIPPATAGVVICAPEAASTMNNPVNISGAATAVNGRHINAMRIYIGNDQRTTVSGNTISEQDTLSPGNYKLTIVAWDNTGQSYVKALFFTVN